MQIVEQAYNFTADLYWIAFLLTGRSELSVAITLAILDSEDDAELFSSPSISRRLRTRAIAKALAAVCNELVLSARETASQQMAELSLPPSSWSLDPNTTKLEVENALLAIDIFPRCALLLTVFEGFSLKTASTLLTNDSDLVLKARTMGLRELTRQLACTQGCSWNFTTASERPHQHQNVSLL